MILKIVHRLQTLFTSILSSGFIDAGKRHFHISLRLRNLSSRLVCRYSIAEASAEKCPTLGSQSEEEGLLHHHKIFWSIRYLLREKAILGEFEINFLNRSTAHLGPGSHFTYFHKLPPIELFR